MQEMEVLQFSKLSKHKNQLRGYVHASLKSSTSTVRRRWGGTKTKKNREGGEEKSQRKGDKRDNHNFQLINSKVFSSLINE